MLTKCRTCDVEEDLAEPFIDGQCVACVRKTNKRAVVQFVLPTPSPRPQSVATKASNAGWYGCLILLAIPLVCGGLLCSSVATTRNVAPRKDESTPAIYVARREVICATDPDFLDSSPLIAPARFVRVPEGNQVAIAGYGGLTDKMYWKLTNGSEQIYIYRDEFRRSFDKVKEGP